MIPMTETPTPDLQKLAVERWREKQLEMVSRGDLKTLKSSYEDPWCAASHVDNLPNHLKVTTPLVRSVLTQEERIAEYLIKERREKIAFPHVPNCACSLCLNLRKDQRLAYVYVETVLQALTSQFYHHMRPKDENTMQQCINLKRRIDKLDYLHYANPEGMKTVKQNLEHVLTSLLDACTTQDECFALILGNSRKSKDKLGAVEAMIETDMILPVIHSSSNVVIESANWHGLEWMKDAPLRILCVILFSILGYFVITPLLILFPHKKLRAVCYNPRYIHDVDMASYIVTVVLIILWTFQADNFYNAIVSMVLCPNDSIKSSIPPLYIILMIYFLCRGVGNVVLTSIEIFQFGGKHFIRRLDFFKSLLHISTALLLAGYTSMIIWITKSQEGLQTFLQKMQLRLNFSNTEVNIFYTCICNSWNFSAFPCNPKDAYCSIHNKTFLLMGNVTYLEIMNSMVPQVVGSGLIGFANMLMILSLGYATYTNKHLGMITLSISKVLKDITVFYLIIIVMIVAWSCYMSLVYKMVSCANKEFYPEGNSILTFFWGLFTMTSISSYKLTNEALQSHPSGVTIETFGLIGYILFIITGAIVMINLLIAMMSETFSNSSETATQHWLYQVTLIKVNRIRTIPTIPSPFSLLLPVHYLMVIIWDKIEELINKDKPNEPEISYMDAHTNLEFNSVLLKCKERAKIKYYEQLKRVDR